MTLFLKICGQFFVKRWYKVCQSLFVFMFIFLLQSGRITGQCRQLARLGEFLVGFVLHLVLGGFLLGHLRGHRPVLGPRPRVGVLLGHDPDHVHVVEEHARVVCVLGDGLVDLHSGSVDVVDLVRLVGVVVGEVVGSGAVEGGDEGQQREQGAVVAGCLVVAVAVAAAGGEQRGEQVVEDVVEASRVVVC